MSEATPGTIVGGDFRILLPLQAGGMGAVYIAEQLSTGKRRALKLMHARLVDDTVQRERFVREARVAAKVDSEHVVEVLAAGVTEGTAIPWLAMELLRGCDLSRLIHENGPLTLAQALPIMEQLCHGLGAAHDAGIVHRDLKPQNVFLCRLASSARPWSVKVLDFGIAKVMADRNQTTAALGSPAWMAPEQTDTSSDMAPAADVWALGLVLFWMLTGRFYWKAMNEQNTGVQAVLREMLFEPLVSPSDRAAELEGEVDFPTALDDWILRCMQRSPEERFQNANVAWHELRAAAGGDMPASHVLPPDVAELAARAAVDLTPDIPARPDPGSPTRAAALPTTRRDGSPRAETPPASEGSNIASGSSAEPESRDHAPSDGAEPGPTLQSHELGVAREAADAGAAGWVKWLLAAAFVAGAAGAVALSQSEDEDAAAVTTPAPPASAPRDAVPPSTVQSPATASAPTSSADPVADLVARATAALDATQLDEAERLAGQALQRLGALNGRRPATSAPNALGDRAQTLLARVAISRGQLAGPLPAGAPRNDVRKALDTREPFLVEARLGCTKGKTWLAEGEGSCCQVYLAAALAEVEASAEGTGVSRWTEQVDAALEAAASPPRRCQAPFARLQDRHPAPDAPKPAATTRRANAPFSPSRAQAALNAKAAEAKATCRDYLGQPVHSFSVTFTPAGSVSVSAPAPDPAGKCIHAVLSRIKFAPYAAASGPKTLSTTVSLR